MHWLLFVSFSHFRYYGWHFCICQFVFVFLLLDLQSGIGYWQLFLSNLIFLQITRSIGDIYLKKTEYNREPLYAKFRVREPFNRPILSSEPSISVHPLQPYDKFIIFASDGLWEHLSNQEAVDIVQSHPRNVSSQPCLSYWSILS